jgi:serine/threonine protein phosphatase PrpC
MVSCPACGEQNRDTAKFCKYCGADLPPILDPVVSRAEPMSVLSELTRTVQRWLGNAPTPASPTPTRPFSAPNAGGGPVSPGPAQPQPPSRPQISTRLTPLERDTILSDPYNPERKYGIVIARELPRSIYYDALDLTCPTCNFLQQSVPTDGLCQHCQTPLQPVLIHERRPRPDGHLPVSDIGQLIRLSTNHPHILPHRAVIQYRETIYTVVEHPGRWGVLVRGYRQRSPEEALAGTAQIGQALAYLHGYGFAHSQVGGTSIEGLIAVGGEASIKLADLSTCTRLQSAVDEALQAQVNSDVAFLAWLLFYLATGKELSRADIELAPPSLRPLIEQALQGQYGSVQDALSDLLLLPTTSPLDRSLKPMHGQATHPGQRHPRNEDAVITFTLDKEQEGRSVPIGFYLVADGMGGHDAGDLASRIVNQIVTNWIIQTKVLPDLDRATYRLSTEDKTGGMLAQAVQQANEALVSHGKTTNSDLGSTVTAALVIGDMATITNVGDSRTYLLRDGRLEQITKDHSLVARLVDAGVIRPENVRTHPQRNQIYRCLGYESDVEVDTFTRQLRAGDVLVLCSDGLWEMVLDEEIQRIIESVASPQQACDALIEAANRTGGEDNIAVIVVRME